MSPRLQGHATFLKERAAWSNKHISPETHSSNITGPFVSYFNSQAFILPDTPASQLNDNACEERDNTSASQIKQRVGRQAFKKWNLFERYTLSFF